MFVIVTSLSWKHSDNTDILLNIQLHSNNATYLHHLSSHSTPRCRTTQRLLWRHFSHV